MVTGVPSRIPTLEQAGVLTHYVISMREETRNARWYRMRLNERNREAARSIQNFRAKGQGQSREFIPKTATTLEQFSAFLKRGLIAQGTWFSFELSEEAEQLFSSQAVGEWMKTLLSDLPDDVSPTKRVPFEIKVSDAAKTALLEVSAIFKVTAQPKRKPGFEATEADTVELEDQEYVDLRIDLARPEDYHEDSTGRQLFELHDTEEDVHTLVGQSGDLSDPNVIYDASVMEEIQSDYIRPEWAFHQRRKDVQGKDHAQLTRRRVRLTEFWGTVLDDEGAGGSGASQEP